MTTFCVNILPLRRLDIRERKKGEWCLFLFNVAVLPSFPKASVFCQTFMWDKVTRGSFHSSLPGDIRHPPAVCPPTPPPPPPPYLPPILPLENTEHLCSHISPSGSPPKNKCTHFFRATLQTLWCNLKIVLLKIAKANINIVYTAPLPSGEEIWQLDRMS